MNIGVSYHLWSCVYVITSWEILKKLLNLIIKLQSINLSILQFYKTKEFLAILKIKYINIITGYPNYFRTFV